MNKAVTERPTRPILHLTATAAPAPKDPKTELRCKPCRSVVEIDTSLDDTDTVRCPACGAARAAGTKQGRTRAGGAV